MIPVQPQKKVVDMIIQCPPVSRWEYDKSIESPVWREMQNSLNESCPFTAGKGKSTPMIPMNGEMNERYLRERYPVKASQEIQSMVARTV